MRDSTQKDFFTIQNTALWVSPGYSVYGDYDRFLQDSVLRSQLTTVSGSGSISVGSKDMKNYSSTRIVKNTGKMELTIFDRILSEYRINENMIPIKWKILPESKTFGGYKCQKAIGNVKGRTYEAWFTNDVPVQDGPWKLFNLPGLILEAHDLKGEVFFDFVSISSNHSIDAYHLPISATTVTLADFKKLINAYLENPTAFSGGITGGGLSGGTFVPNSQTAVTSRPAARKNNSLELEE